MTDDLRRVDDDRYEKLEDKVDGVAKTVGEIRDMLISEPEASPLGRSLLKASKENRRLIDEMEDRYEPMYDWWQQQRGVWRAVIGLAVVIGIVGAFFGISAYFS